MSQQQGFPQFISAMTSDGKQQFINVNFVIRAVMNTDKGELTLILQEGGDTATHVLKDHEAHEAFATFVMHTAAKPA